MDETNKGARISLHSVGSLFCDSWKLYKERFAVLMEIVLVPTLVIILGIVLISLGGLISLLGVLIMLLGYIVFIFSTLPVIYSIHHASGVDDSYKLTIPM